MYIDCDCIPLDYGPPSGITTKIKNDNAIDEN